MKKSAILFFLIGISIYSQNNWVKTGGLAEEVPVMVKVYNILGQEIQTLINEVKTPGNYEVNFDSGTLASGIYFYSLKSGNYSAVKKMQLVR